MDAFIPTLVLLVPIVQAQTVDIEDFSNNLATDLAPLFALFGDTSTKQYLSESTLWIDYVIFAMGPIGIMTAITSVIRLCGGPSMRAFIGRAQEAMANVEMELCTSTSRDVCEMFTQGGVTRVLGRPQVLELIWLRDNTQARAGASTREDEERGPDPLLPRPEPDWKSRLLPMRDFIGELAAAPEAYPGRDWYAPLAQRRNRVIPTSPNLSINVGIRKPSTGTLALVAGVGVLLQSGVVVFAAISTWYLRFESTGAYGGGYAQIMFIAGTVLLCLGMFSCAALIGETTQEDSFSRGPSRVRNDSTELIWLQRGNRLIADQNFDAYAMFEGSDSLPKLVKYTTSVRIERRAFRALVFPVVLATIIGYITQFIGLRGMGAWVSVAHLGVMVVMTLLRNALRLGRLSDVDENHPNELAKLREYVVGYELEWLASELTHRDSQYQGNRLRGLSKERWRLRKRRDLQERPSPCQRELTWHISPAYYDYDKDPASPRCQVTNSLFQARVLLSQLTSENKKKSGVKHHQIWTPSAVAARAKAKQVAEAVNKAMDALDYWNLGGHDSSQDGGDDEPEAERISIKVPAAACSESHEGQGKDDIVEIELTRPPDDWIRGWHIDVASIESLLGLWLWSIQCDERDQFNSNGEGREAAELQVSRAVILGAVELHADSGTDEPHLVDDLGERYPEWREQVGFGLAQTELCLDCIGQVRYSATTIFSQQGTHGPWRRVNRMRCVCRNECACGGDREPRNPGRKLRRFFGWSCLYGAEDKPLSWANEPPQRRFQTRTFKVAYVQTVGSLLENCAQELFYTIMAHIIGENVKPAGEEHLKRYHSESDDDNTSPLDATADKYRDYIASYMKPSDRREVPEVKAAQQNDKGQRVKEAHESVEEAKQRVEKAKQQAERTQRQAQAQANEGQQQILQAQAQVLKAQAHLNERQQLLLLAQQENETEQKWEKAAKKIATRHILRNRINRTVSAFVEAGLGSQLDAYPSLLNALSSLSLPGTDLAQLLTESNIER